MNYIEKKEATISNKKIYVQKKIGHLPGYI